MLVFRMLDARSENLSPEHSTARQLSVTPACFPENCCRALKRRLSVTLRILNVRMLSQNRAVLQSGGA